MMRAGTPEDQLRHVRWLLLCLVSMASCTDQGEELCDRECSCEICTESEHDACDTEYEELEADASTCIREHGAYLDCLEERATCDGGQFDDWSVCNDERERLHECIP